MGLLISHNHLLCLVIAMGYQCVFLEKVYLSAEESIVWGPGLESRFYLPARYFFIQAVDEHKINLTESAGAAFDVKVDTTDGRRSRIWTQLLDRHDGSYIVRFRLFESYKDLQISVTHDGKHVADSPYLLQGWVYHEKCSCPEPDLEKFLKDLDCPASYEQIDSDLDMFKQVDMKMVVPQAVKKFNQAGMHSICHYVVLQNNVHRTCYGQHVGFKMFMDNILLSLARKVKLPDMEFIVNLGDWPLEQRSRTKDPLPLFSWCGSDETYDIVMPTYDLTESSLEMQGRVMLDMLSVQSHSGPIWSNKSSKAFWRGRDSRQERLDLVSLSRQHPDKIDAALTNFFFFRDREHVYGPKVPHVSFMYFFQYKYQISLDGTVAAYRFPYLLGGDSVVLKQDSTYYEYFYKRLRPFVHYVPFKRDLSDLLEQLDWVINNDEEAKEISRNAQEFARSNLLPHDVFCYHTVLFKEWSKRLLHTPSIPEGMEQVPQESESCHCDKQFPAKDEL